MSHVAIKQDECKGCKLCIKACPRGVLVVSESINKLGYQPACVKSDNCIGCGICYYSCPEPGAISVFKDKKEKNESS